MKYKFLIYISYSYAIPIGNPLEKEILDRGFSVRWFADLKNGKKAIEHKTNILKSIEDLIDYQPDIVLTATDDVPDFISGLKVQIFHGFLTYKRPEKKNLEAHFRIRGFFDLYCTQGPSTTEGFNRQKNKYPYFEVIETGWSKVDPLFPIKIKENTKTIMIASTFTERLSLAHNDAVFNEIKRLSNSSLFNFIMVLHPKLPEVIVEKWKTLNGENFKFYNTTNLIPLFQDSDILFADTTSAIQEYLLQKKPVVTFNHTFRHDYLIHVNEANALEETFTYALSYPKDLIKKIEPFVHELHPYIDFVRMKEVKVFSQNSDLSFKEKLTELIHDFDGIRGGLGKRNVIKIIKLNGENLNIKAFKIPNAINQIAYNFFRKSKAQRSFEYANKLIDLEVGTPMPIAYFEYKTVVLFKKSYYISEQLDCDLTYRELVHDFDYPDYDNILRTFTRFTFDLHEKGIQFLDHSPGNTLIKKQGDTYKFYLVDLNRMNFGPLDFETRIKNFARLSMYKSMVEIMSQEYAKCIGEDYNKVFDLMWQETQNFRKKFTRKKELKKKFKL